MIRWARTLALRGWLAVIFITGLSACVITPVALQADAKPTVHKGRFAVTFETQGAVQREQGGFEWHSFGTDPAAAMQLLLTSPLGTTLAALTFDPAANAQLPASLQTPQGTRHARSLPELMQKTLGWDLPLQLLLPWLANTPAASNASGQKGEWDIAVLSRHENGTPKVLAARSDARNIALRLVFEAPE